MPIDPTTHKRFLDYRQRHSYFGKASAMLTQEEFIAADAEQRALDARGDARTDEEEERFVDLCALLFRD